MPKVFQVLRIISIMYTQFQNVKQKRFPTNFKKYLHNVRVHDDAEDFETVFQCTLSKT
jgi:hypothetical protein